MTSSVKNEHSAEQSRAEYSNEGKTYSEAHQQAHVRGNDFFHSVARDLLREILLEIIKTNDGVSQGIIDFETAIEATRIAASDLIIAYCLHLDVEEVVDNPDIGISCVSTDCCERPEFAHWVFEAVRRITPAVGQLPFLDRIKELKFHQLIKVLEAIHEVAVYGAVGLLPGNERFSRFRFNKKNSLRKQRGAFYTPVQITEFICESTIGRYLDERIGRSLSVLGEERLPLNNLMTELRNVFGITIIDPACGPGAFLTSSLMTINSRRQRILAVCENLRREGSLSNEERSQLDDWINILQNESSFLKYFEGRMYGVDLDPAALEVASLCLSILSGRAPDLEGVKFLYGVNLKEGNSLISELPPRSVKPHSDELQTLLNLRQQLRARGTREKTKIVREYQDTIAQIQRHQIHSDKVRHASQFFQDIKRKKTFCWELEFPEIFYSNDDDAVPGFKFLVMNPPYDLLKPNRSELTRLYNVRGPSQFKIFEALRRTVEEEVAFYRESGHYSLATENMLNLYKLMIERALTITSSTAILGFIVPSTLLADKSAEKLRREILDKYEIKAIFDFLESAKIFPGVSQAVCVVILDKSKKGDFVPLASNLTQLDDLAHLKPYPTSLNWVKMISGDYRIPRVTEFGWKVLEKMHSNPRLSEVHWILNLRGEVDLTAYSDCLSMDDTGVIVVRGNNISRYVLRWRSGKKESFILKERFLRRLGNSPKTKHISENRIAGQQISNMMQRWRLKFCFIKPGTCLGNSCNYVFISKEVENRESLLLYLLALLNSCLLNWRFKLTSTNNHVSNLELDSLPIRTVDRTNLWEDQLFGLIVDSVRRVLESGTAKVVPEVEAAIFSLYRLTSEEVEFVLRSEGADEHEVEDILGYFHNLQFK